MFIKYTALVSPSLLFTIVVFSEADDYSFNAAKNSNFRMILVNRVVVGKPCKRRQNATNITEPPCGHHSVRPSCEIQVSMLNLFSL